MPLLGMMRMKLPFSTRISCDVDINRFRFSGLSALKQAL
jgi:hypothetical protein